MSKAGAGWPGGSQATAGAWSDRGSEGRAPCRVVAVLVSPGAAPSQGADVTLSLPFQRPCGALPAGSLLQTPPSPHLDQALWPGPRRWRPLRGLPRRVPSPGSTGARLEDSPCLTGPPCFLFSEGPGSGSARHPRARLQEALLGAITPQGTWGRPRPHGCFV